MFDKLSPVAIKLACAFMLTFFGGHAMAAGALAIGSNRDLTYGWAINFPNTAIAEQEALFECGSGCMVVLRFDSGCGAFATDQADRSNASGWGAAASGPDAQSRAISECTAHGGMNCMVRVWGCNKMPAGRPR